MDPDLWLSRRRFMNRFALGAAAISASGLFVPGAFAEELTRTPAQTEGPFYPDRLPLDTDNDLLILNDAITPAVGEVTHLTGRVPDARGDPGRNAGVESWQSDQAGASPRAGAGRGAVVPRPAAARHGQRPADPQRRDHAGRRRGDAPHRAGARRQGGSGSKRRGGDLAVRPGRRVPAHRDGQPPEA